MNFADILKSTQDVKLKQAKSLSFESPLLMISYNEKTPRNSKMSTFGVKRSIATEAENKKAQIVFNKCDGTDEQTAGLARKNSFHTNFVKVPNLLQTTNITIDNPNLSTPVVSNTIVRKDKRPDVCLSSSLKISVGSSAGSIPMFYEESTSSQPGCSNMGLGVEYCSNDKDLVVDKFSIQIPTNRNCDESIITDEVKLKKLHPGKDSIVFCTNSRQAV